MRCATAIKFLLNKVKEDFGKDFLIKIFIITNKKLGYTLRPLDDTILRILVEYGFEIKNVKSVVEYEK